jgi:hypothetical protein
MAARIWLIGDAEQLPLVGVVGILSRGAALRHQDVAGHVVAMVEPPSVEHHERVHRAPEAAEEVFPAYRDAVLCLRERERRALSFHCRAKALEWLPLRADIDRDERRRTEIEWRHIFSPGDVPPGQGKQPPILADVLERQK